MQLELLAPELLHSYGAIALVVLAAALLVALYSAFMSGRGQGEKRTSPALPRQKGAIVSICLRAGAMLCVLLALAELVMVDETTERQALVLVDVSDSMDAASAEALLRQARPLVSGFDVSVVPFAGEVSAVQSINGTLPSYQAIRSSAASIGQTNLEGGLRVALGRVGPESTYPIILVSDGYETLGNALQAASGLRDRSIPLFPLLPSSRAANADGFRISSLSVPLIAPAQKSVEVRISIENTGKIARTGTLRVTHDKRVILEQKVRAEPGTEILKLAQSDPSQDGIRKIVAELIPDDTTLLPSEQSAFLSGEAREKVLLLNGDDQDGRFLEEVLRRQAYQLDSSRAHSGSPEFGKLQEYSSVILNNVSMRQLSEQAVASLKRFVESGGGLVVSGGPQSYGLGGYQNTALEDLLPVRSVPPKAEERRLNVAVQLVIDKSQSMGTSQRLEFAKEASREVIKSLKDEDFIGVIGFDETPYEVLRMMSVAGNRDHAIERVGRLFPKGGTWLLPALREGKRRLEATPAGRKHMIIVTDGQLRDAGPVYLEDVRQARMLGITVSTVLIGGEMDFGFLRSLSEAGGGRYYTANDPSQLPRIFIQDVGIRSGEKTIKESEEFAVRLGVGELRSTSVRSFPPLRGFVETRIRPEANFELAVASGVELYPLLASWNFGKGKVAAFASDNNGRWSALWVPWGRFAEFWTSLVDSTRATSEERAKNIKFDLRHYVTRDALTLDVAVYDDIEPATLLADLVLPDSTSREARFERVSRGRYQLTLSEADAGTYRVALKTSGPAPLGRFTPVGFDVSGELFGERRGLGYNIALLEQLARTTGGRINPGAEDLATLAATRKEITDLRPYLLSLALIFFLLEIVRRELGFRLAISPQRAQSSPR